MKLKNILGIIIICISIIIIIAIPTYIYSMQREKAKWEENVEEYGIATNSIENVPQDILDGTRQVLHIGQDINELDQSKPFSIEVEDSAEKARLENEQEIQRKRDFAQDVINNPEKYRGENIEFDINNYEQEPETEYGLVLSRMEKMIFKYYDKEFINKLEEEDSIERRENPYKKTRYKSEEKMLKMLLDLLEGDKITEDERKDIDTFMKREYFDNIEDKDLRDRIIKDGYSLKN